MGAANDSDGAGDFNDYYEGRHADYDGHGGDYTRNNVTGSTTGGGSNLTDGEMIHSWKFKYGSEMFPSLRETAIENARCPAVTVEVNTLTREQIRYAFCMHLAAVNLRLGLNAFHTHLFVYSCG